MKLLKPFVVDAPIQPASLTIPELEETEAQLQEKKQRFAEMYLRDGNAFNVCLALYPNDTSKALRLSNSWPTDPEVKVYMESIQQDAAEFEFHPTKEQFARKLLNHAETLLSIDPQTAHRYHDSYRKMRWPDAGVNISDNRVVTNVMIVKDHGTPDEWEAKAKEQQRRLKEEATVVSTVARTSESDS